MCVSLPLPKTCGVFGKPQRSLILDTRFGTLTGFCCLGKKNAPPLVKSDPRDYDALDLNSEDTEILARMGIRL
jgi:hypothetical protein